MAEPTREVPRNAGEYQLLYVYLRDRYADRVVLNFADLEGLLGFALPERARMGREWWAGPEPPARPSTQSGAWTLAGRTATLNAAAGIVVFDRQAQPRPHRGA